MLRGRRLLNGKISGFTIVELLIVVVVIAILAAITVVAYNGISQKASDSKMNASIATLEKAMRRFYIETGKMPLGGYNSSGVAADDTCPGPETMNGGWIGTSLYGAAGCTTEDLLRARGYIPSSFVPSLPSNNTYNSWENELLKSRRSVMAYKCNGTGDRMILFWQLRGPADAGAFDAQVAACGIGASFRDAYGMRAARMVVF